MRSWALLSAAILGASTITIIFDDAVLAHGDVAPQAVDTSSLPTLDGEWLLENPWRDPESENWATAVRVGASGYNQNCARCHGLEVISGGLAPDLRYLEADEFGDEWFLERFRHGYRQNGITKMPAFGDLLGQEAAWAIRTYIETRPDDGALDDHDDRLHDILGELKALAQNADAASDDQIEAYKIELSGIAEEIKTASGAPKADSVASRAAAALNGSDNSLDETVEIMTIGLSAAE
ncbi:cytochrome c-550 PedF [Notoacmeibacter sp. MSK16QG-6]|uniref:cytochrome c-550 PedF n=1 Tax=Notoacmeibacter sp. MSK16QG-6 TaxID=2957982 RepID=UPI00209EC725|nr:cytochrome c-550 PedF [Notoacmeibacter sp. MSK16QG-6]MCP1200827.1 cytochrome c-550 PedF [Notoacmeibacter sp. MSK16QG-6]